MVDSSDAVAAVVLLPLTRVVEVLHDDVLEVKVDPLMGGDGQGGVEVKMVDSSDVVVVVLP